MSWRFLVLAAVLLPSPAAGQHSVAEAQQVVNRIHQRVAANLQRLPNYVCRQTIDRSKRSLRSKKFETLDTLRLDVALIGGREMYSWPGSSKFDDASLLEMVKSGAIGSGAYATHPRSLFLRNHSALFQYRGEEQLDGRKALRLDYVVPLEKSEFSISDGAREAVVPYHGTVWADPVSYELVRLDTTVDQVPRDVKITGSQDSIRYQRVGMGADTFTLPSSVEMRITSSIGEFRNRTIFEGCRQYVGESSVRFTGTDTALVVPDSQAPRVVRLPEGLRVEMRLETPLFSGGKMALGDPVTAILSQPVRRNEEILVPKGAKCIGRLTRLEVQKTRELEYMLVGVAFDSLEAPSLKAEFAGLLHEAGVSSIDTYFVPFYSAPGQRRTVWHGLRMNVAPPGLNEAVFCVRGGKLTLSAGFRLVWQTTKHN